MATKEDKRQARSLIEELEGRVHAGPPVAVGELDSAREFLDRSEFSRASDYYQRLSQIQNCLATRLSGRPISEKRNYGGRAGEQWLQVQSAYDHVIVSTCYGGQQMGQRGRIKLSHRFNQSGRIDFVELKLLRSLQPILNGALRKLISMRDYQHLKKDWSSAEGYVLSVLPRELIFLYPDIFRCDRADVLAWLINIGHTLCRDVIASLAYERAGATETVVESSSQLNLSELRNDAVALPILEHATAVNSTVEITGEKTVIVRYCRPD